MTEELPKVPKRKHRRVPPADGQYDPAFSPPARQEDDDAETVLDYYQERMKGKETTGPTDGTVLDTWDDLHRETGERDSMVLGEHLKVLGNQFVAALGGTGLGPCLA